MFGILGFNAAMGKRKKKVSRPSASPRENSNTMPVDIMIDIFSRLSLEDVARCRCVSKLWSAILRRPDFTQLFLKISSARPKILLTFLHNGRRIFYTVPQDLDPERDYSSPICPYYQMDFHEGSGDSEEVCHPILGVICSNEKKPMLYNPSTGQDLSLPSASTKKKEMSPFFGYDPIGKLFKVLCVSEDDYECRVSTIVTEDFTWRTVECSIPHQTLHSNSICIDGTLYYLGQCMADGFSKVNMVVCFDVRRETFKYVPVEFKIWGSALINYKGKLGVLWTNSIRIDENTESFELWTLEDLDEKKWSKTVYTLPSCWKNLAVDTNLYIVHILSNGSVLHVLLQCREENCGTS